MLTFIKAKERLSASGLTPLRHHQGTMTGLSPVLSQFVVPWDDWARPEDGDYSEDLLQIYNMLGIVDGNGQWYVSAYRFDKSISETDRATWDAFVCDVLRECPPDEYWKWADEDVPATSDEK